MKWGLKGTWCLAQCMKNASKSHDTNRHECPKSITSLDTQWFLAIAMLRNTLYFEFGVNTLPDKKPSLVHQPSSFHRRETGQEKSRTVCTYVLHLPGTGEGAAPVFAPHFLKGIWFSKISKSVRHMSLFSVFQPFHICCVAVRCWESADSGEGVQIPFWLLTSLLSGST